MGRPRAVSLALLAVASVACSESSDVVYTDDSVVVWDAASVSATTTVGPAPTGPVLIERIWSPEAGIAEVLGTGARLDDPVTADGEPGNLLQFDLDETGSFTIRVRIAEEGAHTVCVRDECGRVFIVPP